MSKNFVLNFVLHVPNPFYNLISISKLTCDLNWVAKFSPTHHEFQEVCPAKRTSSAREMEGLFILEEELKEIKKVPQVLQCESSSNWMDEIMLGHLRVGHPILEFFKSRCYFLLYLRRMFPIFNMKLVSSLNITKSFFLHKFMFSLAHFSSAQWYVGPLFCE